MDLQSVLKTYKDFPKQGITFFDIIPYLQDKEIYRTLIDRIAECTTAPNVAAPEARGFLFTAPLLIVSRCVHNIIPVRKSGKLPFAEGDLHEVKIVKEYGFDKLYYRTSDIAAGLPTGDVIEISIIDDVLARAARPRVSRSRCRASWSSAAASSIPSESKSSSSS